MKALKEPRCERELPVDDFGGLACAPSSFQQIPKGPTKYDPHHQRQDWDDEAKLENSKRKLHQGYQEFQNKRKKIQLLDIKNLPMPLKPHRGQVLYKNSLVTSSRKCGEPCDLLESRQNPKGPTKSTDHDHHRQDWDNEEKLATSVRRLHQGYQEFQNKRKKIQLLDNKNLPLLSTLRTSRKERPPGPMCNTPRANAGSRKSTSI